MWPPALSWLSPLRIANRDARHSLYPGHSRGSRYRTDRSGCYHRSPASRTLDKASLSATTSRVSALFARVFELAGSEELHFHDSRHEALCRWVLEAPRPLTSEQLGRAAGMRDARTRQRYLSLRGSELADMLGWLPNRVPTVECLTPAGWHPERGRAAYHDLCAVLAAARAVGRAHGLSLQEARQAPLSGLVPQRRCPPSRFPRNASARTEATEL
jgi:hypothetical protein